MRLRPAREWRDEPFSYSKIWMALSVWFGFATAPLIAFDPKGWELSGLILWGLVNLGFQKGVKLLVWSRLSPGFRDALPYDRQQAATGKGVIHSYRDLWRWLRK